MQPPGVPAPEEPTRFKALIEREEHELLKPRRQRQPATETRPEEAPRPVDGLMIAEPGFADEPWVAFTPRDRVGLAFSGGGIRSATFNLGVLQGLQRLDLLRHFHYLATVSGGGYIGAWWTAWLSRRPKEAGLFPGYDKEAAPALQRMEANTAAASTAPSGTKSPPPKRETREPDEVRHLREFSNFLSPRIGFFETEMWSAILAIISAMLPALIVATAVIAAGLLVSLLVAVWTMSSTVLGGHVTAFIVAMLIMFVVQWRAEWVWCGKEKAEDHKFPVEWWGGILAVGVVLAAGAWWLIAWFRVLEIANFSPGGWGATEPSTWTRLGIRPEAGFFPSNRREELLGAAFFTFDRRIFHVPLAWTMTALFMLLVLRIPVLRIWGENRKMRARIATADRLLQRLLAGALVWVAVAAIWLAGAWLNNRSAVGGASAATGALVSGGLLGLLRNWLTSQLTSSKKSGALARLKPLLPQLLAYLALLLGAVGIASGIAAGLAAWGWWFWGGAAAGTALIIAWCIFVFDPAQVSMHAFYRNRLARAYLGASNRDGEEGQIPRAIAAENRQVDLRASDDRFLHELLEGRSEREEDERGPLHLVCCAANNLSGDPLGTLARGSRSAVLSPIGFSIGNFWRAWKPDDPNNVTTASAITASAAAFNSNMGSVSMSLGPAVTFLMTAFNLRLGLWLKHPLLKGDLGPQPGYLFLCEMASMSLAGVPAECGGKLTPTSNYVHLSDGAHFENLAIYELVRRHCRYIIATDCGADPALAFEDLGNAIRRIRQDFGVEIDIDVNPLRPDPVTGLSAQHAVVGTIYYDRELSDTGTLIFLKPNVTGDESPDVAHYRTRNKKFPHETTGDQFYDEAQWESYRRLGEHAIRTALRFGDRPGGSELQTAAQVFSAARAEWYPGPPNLAERVVAATDRIGALERQLRDENLTALRRELFPEIGELERALADTPARESGDASTTPPAELAAARAEDEALTTGEIERNVPSVLEVFRIMQSVWLSCELDTYWSHPLNLGLFNLFQRWAYAPSCRLWWPLLRPMYGSRFRRFMEEHLNLRDEDHPELQGAPEGPTRTPPDGLAWMHWLRSPPAKNAPLPSDASFYEYVIKLPVQVDRTGEVKHVPVQLGLLAFRDDAEKIQWHSDHFFVPPSLWGSGIGGQFLSQLIEELDQGEKKQIIVTFGADDAAPHTDFSSRQQRNDLIAFYKRAGFVHRDSTKMVRGTL